MNELMSALLLALASVGALVVSLLIPAVLIYRWRAKENRSLRKSPLTDQLLRSPGHSLRQKIDEIDNDLDAVLAMLFVMPFAMLAMHVCDSYYRGVTVHGPVR